jgi:hypothetical protein
MNPLLEKRDVAFYLGDPESMIGRAEPRGAALRARATTPP